MNPTQVEKDNRVRAKSSTILDHLDYHNRHLTNRGLSQELSCALNTESNEFETDRLRTVWDSQSSKFRPTCFLNSSLNFWHTDNRVS